MPATVAPADTAQLFRILGETNRLAIISHLVERGPLCVTDVAKELGVSVANASHHLVVLEGAGLVGCRPKGRCRIYSVCDDRVPSLLQVAGPTA